MLVGDERPMKVTVQKLFDPRVRRTQKMRSSAVVMISRLQRDMGVVEKKINEKRT
jgi:hypothetical protein